MIYTLTVLCRQNLIATPVRRNVHILSDTGQFNVSVFGTDEHLEIDLNLKYQTFVNE